MLQLLCSEVGENVSVIALSSVPGWRGRAEQIRNLQQKITELQIRLSEHEKSQKEFSSGKKRNRNYVSSLYIFISKIYNCLTLLIYNLFILFASLERQNLANLRVVEKERRQQIENTAKEFRQAEVALETSKRKLDAAKARIKVLENELNIAKGNVTMLNEKRSHDDRLIDALNVSSNQEDPI